MKGWRVEKMRPLLRCSTRCPGWAPLLLSALSALGCSGEPEPVKKPVAPDMSELAAAYEAPTAALTPETAAAVFDAVNELVARLGVLGLEEQLIDTIGTTIDEQLAQTANTAETSSALGLEDGERLERLEQRATKGDAYLLARRICGGFGPKPLPDPMNGAITLTLGVSGERLDPVLWGKFEACQYRLGASTVLLTGEGEEPGSYSVWVGNDLSLKDFKLSTILLQLSLWTEVNGEGELLELDFRLNVETLELDFRIPLEAGYVIAKASSTLIGISATNGEFGCDAAARACTAGDQRIEF